MNEARALAKGEDEKLDLWSSIPFFAIHVLAIVAPFFLPFSWKLVGLALLLYYARMAGTTIGYHRYASHRGFKTSRAFQFVLAFWAQTSAQKGMLWWAAHHRNNHNHFMSSANQGFFWWELDPSYYLIRVFQALGLVWDVRTPPEKVRSATIAAQSSQSDEAPAPVSRMGALEMQL